MKLISLLQLYDKLQQAGKVENLQQVYSVFGTLGGDESQNIFIPSGVSRTLSEKSSCKSCTNYLAELHAFKLIDALLGVAHSNSLQRFILVSPSLDVGRVNMI